MTSNFNKRDIGHFQIAFVNLQHECNTDYTIAKYIPYIKPKYVTQEGTTVLMFDIITIGTSARLSLPDTISNRNIGMQKEMD